MQNKQPIDLIPTSNVTQGDEAFRGLLDGIKRATSAVRLSYGPKGLNAVVENELYPFSQTANDAETIIQAIQVSDPVEKIGLNYLKELSTRQDKTSGDGRKTSLIIAEAILEEALKVNVSGVELKRELDALIPFIENEINKEKKSITEDDVEKVATIAGESKEIGKIVGEIYRQIGAGGVIIPESSGTYHTTTTFIRGVRFIDTGFLSPFMSSEGEKTKAVYKDPLILITKTKIERDKEVEGLIEQAIFVNKALIIVCDDMDTGVAQRLIATHRAKVAKILIIKAPTLWKNFVFEDFAKVTGATIVEPASGVTFKNLKLEHLGSCDKIEVSKDETVIMPNIDYSEHINTLQEENTQESKLRLSWLQTNTCILKLGANNESELSYLRLKTADAINSSKLALEDGVVAGGGLCLGSISEKMPDTIAGNILLEALFAPFAQLKTNDPNHSPSEDVIDAAKVIKNAVRNAISLASTVLTTGIIINLVPKKAETLKDKQMIWN